MTGTNQGIVTGLVLLLASCGDWGDVSSAELDLSIDAAYVTQGTQDAVGGVPLVQGRDGWVRVFVTANQPSNAWPDVKVTLLEGGAPVKTLIIPASAPVPFEADPGSMTRSWNVRLAGADVQPGRSLQITLGQGDRNAANDTWPAPGVAEPLDVRAAPLLEVMFVPLKVTDGWGASTWATISEADLAVAEESLRTFLPVQAISTSVHPAVQTAIDLRYEEEPVVPALYAVDDLRVLEQPAGSTVHYVAILPLAAYVYGYYGGVGYLDDYSVAAWDYGFDPGESLFPHELGHNFGLHHTPCPGGSGISGVDPAWPTDPAHAGAHLGTWGMDVASGEPKDPATYFDLMSYCTPVWVSDYTYELALALRAAAAPAPGVAPAALAGPGVLLSGSLDPRSGAAIREPVLVSTAGPSPSAGPDTLEARDAGGALLLSVPFTPAEIAAPGETGLEGFAFTVPLAPARAASIAELRWVRGGVEVARRAVGRIEAPVRDPATGAVVAFPMADGEVTP